MAGVPATKADTEQGIAILVLMPDLIIRLEKNQGKRLPTCWHEETASEGREGEENLRAASRGQNIKICCGALAHQRLGVAACCGLGLLGETCQVAPSQESTTSEVR